MTVVADVNNSIRPGLFKGSWDGVKAWGDYMNSQGGLACRKVVVKQGDSKLSPTDATNAAAAACSDSVAMIGTTALFLQDVSGMESCKDKAGVATGIPDIAVTQTEVGAAVFEDLVRGTADRFGVSVQRDGPRGRSRSGTRSTTTSSTSSARTRCTACS